MGCRAEVQGALPALQRTQASRQGNLHPKAENRMTWTKYVYIYMYMHIHIMCTSQIHIVCTYPKIHRAGALFLCLEEYPELQVP